jgi:succinate-semialdehyde dehydrogenase/glutarate-semialdehyde dehydrogenase
MQAKFRNGGQACTAANRFLVRADVAEPFTDRIVQRVAARRLGPGDAAGTDVGPLVDARAVRKIDELVRRAVAQGARVLAGGRLGRVC